MDPKYRLASKRRLTGTLLPNVYEKCLFKVQEEIIAADTTVLESDAWTDDRNKAFFANTSSTINDEWVEKSFLLACKRFKGKHTGVRLFDAYKGITNQFKINNKITHNITDAAANMKRALGKTSFLNKKIIDGVIHEASNLMNKETLNPISEEDEENDETIGDVDEFIANSQATTNASDSESTTVTKGEIEQVVGEDLFDRIFEDDDEDECPERLNCIAHQLQLVIKDSKTDCRHIEKNVELVASLVAKGSQSYLIKDRIELFNGFMGKNKIYNNII